MADGICFHAFAQGALAGQIITEQQEIKLKPFGNLKLICNCKPIIEVLGVGLGPIASQLAPLTDSVAPSISWEDSVINIPAFATAIGPAPYYATYPTVGGTLVAEWTYVAGYVHTYMTGTVAQGATTIELAPNDLTNTLIAGLDSYTVPVQVAIRDGSQTETVIISEINGTTATLLSPTQFAHTPPAWPDFIPVSAVPWDIDQAVISLVSVLLKMRGSRAANLPAMPGAPMAGISLARAGALGDYENAERILKPFRMSYMGT
jgi:hypothetical protein